MCMYSEPLQRHKMNEVEMILVSILTILVGGIIGISCARAIPSSFIIEASLAVIILFLIIHLSRRKKDLLLAEDENFIESRYITSAKIAAFDAERAELLTQKRTPSFSKRSLNETTSSQPPPAAQITLGPKRQVLKEIPETEPKRIPIHVRVEQERLRLLSIKENKEPAGARATAHCLKFRDTQGRNIRYAVRTSQKGTSATLLELLVEGKSPRKVRSIVYDDASHMLLDGKNKFFVPSSDVTTVMKSLNLLCKVASVKLDCVHGSPGLKKAVSNLDLLSGPAGSSRSILSSSQRSL
mmetsp:Transcript_28775/g.60741  ORF Transcript_28775/g.60741 Transcript_28775/m.60741 type:complete len:297 (+) Transcript_28775:214-1104(+)